MVIINLGKYTYDIEEDQLVREIAFAVDSVLGEGTLKLIFKTAKLVYDIDYVKDDDGRSFASSPKKLQSFEQFVRKVLGDDVCNSIMLVLSERLQKYKVSSFSDEKRG